MEIQDPKTGKILVRESIIANEKQKNCNHNWIKVGQTYECPKCYSVTIFKNKTMKNKLKGIGKYAGLALILFITYKLYYLIFKYGITSFDSPVVGIFAAVFMPILAILYYIFFLKKSR